MRDYNLRFFQSRWPDEIFELESEAIEHFAQVPGCYVLGSADGTGFIYPCGRSPVFYIGTSKALRARLLAHRKWIVRARKEHHRQHFAPLHQYGAVFGVDIAVYRKRTSQSIFKLESTLITEFYNIYGFIPVANGAWPKQMRSPLGINVT